MANQQLCAIVLLERGDGFPGVPVYSLGICLAVVVSGSLAPLAEGFRERLDGNCRHVVFMPETPHEVYSLVVAFRIAVTGRKEIVGSGEGLIEDGDE